jgi:hypothetical protein
MNLSIPQQMGVVGQLALVRRHQTVLELTETTLFQWGQWTEKALDIVSFQFCVN